MRLHHAVLALAITAAFSIGANVTAGASNVDGGDISRISNSINIAPGTRAGDLETVNGSISIGADAVIETAETVNGSVRAADGARAQYLETVNGSISLGQRVSISQYVETVNGGITFGEDAEVLGNAETVNGDFRMAPRAHVGGQIVTQNGDITLKDDARVDGGILVKKVRSSWWGGGNQRLPVITIGPRAVVGGELVFEREVELNVHSTAKIGTVKGATAKMFGGDTQVEK